MLPIIYQLILSVEQLRRCRGCLNAGDHVVAEDMSILVLCRICGADGRLGTVGDVRVVVEVVAAVAELDLSSCSDDHVVDDHVNDFVVGDVGEAGAGGVAGHDGGSMERCWTSCYVVIEG